MSCQVSHLKQTARTFLETVTPHKPLITTPGHAKFDSIE